MNACGFDRFDFYGCLDRVESAIAREIRLRIGPSDFPNTFGGMRNWAGFDFGRRTRSVREAINESQSIALRNLHAKLRGISLQDIWPLLADICHDLTLYLGGGAIAGAAIGAGLGFMVFGVGAIPGAVAGTAMGAKIGAMLLNFIGLKSVIEYMIDNVPLAIAEYQKGFLDAWEPVPSPFSSWEERRPSRFYSQSTGLAAHSFAAGHEIIVVALLMGIVTYLGRGKGNLQTLLSEAKSGGLGPKFATWLEANAGKLTANPLLQARSKEVSQSAGGRANSRPAGDAEVGLGARTIVPVQAKAAKSIETARLSGGLRRPANVLLDDAEIGRLTNEFVEIGGDPSQLRFNLGRQTSYVDELDVVRVRGDVLPLEDALHPRSSMSSKATLAHELGHRAHQGTRVPIGAWNDEFRASYWAAKNLPGLSKAERTDLLNDAILRAREAGATIKMNKFMREALYGY